MILLWKEVVNKTEIKANFFSSLLVIFLVALKLFDKITISWILVFLIPFLIYIFYSLITVGVILFVVYKLSGGGNVRKWF